MAFIAAERGHGGKRHWREEANAGSGHGGKGIGGKWPTGVRTAVSCLARGGRRCGLGPRRIGEIFKSFSWPVKIDILSQPSGKSALV